MLDEVERFVRAMDGTARRAQLLYDALAETPTPQVEARLAELTRENDPARQELVQALTGQLRVLRRMGAQLGAFYDQMEKILVELDTVREASSRSPRPRTPPSNSGWRRSSADCAKG